jgi:hypothetical protein
MQNVFGSGIMWGTQLTDATGAAVAATSQSTLLFGVLQDVAVDFSADVKELFGQNSFPFAVARGKTKISIKAKNAQIYGALFNACFFGQTLSSGIYKDVYDTTGKAIPGTPYTITISSTATDATHIQIPDSGTTGSATLLSIIDSNGIPYTQVSAAPATKQFTWTSTSGAIVFSSTDSAATVFISYQYTATSTTQKNQTITNVPMGYAPIFEVDLFMPYQGKHLTLEFPQCIATKLSFATKLDDFMIPEFDISAFANAAGQVCKVGYGE